MVRPLSIERTAGSTKIAREAQGWRRSESANGFTAPSPYRHRKRLSQISQHGIASAPARNIARTVGVGITAAHHSRRRGCRDRTVDGIAHFPSVRAQDSLLRLGRVLQDANANYTRGAMDKEVAGPTRANYLLQQLAIEQACEAGCRHYHMGESGTSASMAQFKTRFGARPFPYAEYHLERLPLTAADHHLRTAVKRILRFRD